MSTSVLVHSFGNLPAAIDTAPWVTRVNSSVFLCVLCCSVPCCPVTTYCVKFDAQQKLLLNKWALLLCSVVLCLVLCPGTVKIHIFLIIEERVKVWKVFENRHCNKDIDKTIAGRVTKRHRSLPCFIYIVRTRSSFTEKQRKISGPPTVTATLVVIRKAMSELEFVVSMLEQALTPMMKRCLETIIPFLWCVLSFRCVRGLDRLWCTHLLCQSYAACPREGNFLLTQ